MTLADVDPTKRSSIRRLTPPQQLAWFCLDPVRYARAILGHDLWDKQAELLAAIATHPRVAVKACHASSKSHSAAAAVLWWITRYSDGIAITTAPTWAQVERVLWGEIRRQAAMSLIAYPMPLQTALHIGAGNYAIGLSTNEGVRFQGFHGRILLVLDEAPGVLPDIWEAIEGIRAGGDVRVLALGNPTVPSGPFYEAFTSQRDAWHCLSIGAFDTPNLTGLTPESLAALSETELDVCPRPYLVSRRWVREKLADWGPGHPLWASRVMGEFPAQGADALVALAWAEAAARRQCEVRVGDPLVAGVDVAGPGSAETVVVIRHGPQVQCCMVFPEADPRGAVVHALGPWRARPGTPLRVRVDAVGIGYNFALHLRDCGFTVDMVNVGEAANDTERFLNRRAEIFWGLRDRLQAGDIGGITDDRMLGQLVALRYEITPRGQVKLESKDDMARRGVPSPDRADALALAFADSDRQIPLVAPAGLTAASYWKGGQ